MNCPTDFSSLRGKVHDRIWYESADKTSFAVLVDKPIAFGHSQVVMSIASYDTPEEEVFKQASGHIVICIGKFLATSWRSVLDGWGPLAKYTGTSGDYMKTLVLKTSADEKPGLYKVHLVPCFESHVKSANDQYHARFGQSDSGGLLYWIGQREHRVDYDKEMSPSSAVAEKRINSFCLTKLAAILGCPKQPFTPSSSSRP